MVTGSLEGESSDGLEESADDLQYLLEEGLAEEQDATDLIEALVREAAALRANPLDVNSSTVAELARVPGLDPAEAAAIVAFVRSSGPVVSLDELALGGPLSSARLRSVRPYLVCLGRAAAAMSAPEVDVAEEAPLEWSARIRATARVDPKDEWAASSAADLARAARSFCRVRVSRAHWRAGLGIERDPWERSALDHVSGYVAREVASADTPVRPTATGRVADLFAGTALSFTAGDMLVHWGQGLLASSAMFSSTGSLPRTSDVVRGYDGASETTARRGLGVTVSRGAVTAHLVGQRTSLDASCEDGLVTSIRSSGYHRTDGERSGENALMESSLAGRVEVAATDRLCLSVSAASFDYSPGLAEGDPERQRFRFNGDHLDAVSMDMRCASDEWSCGAEAAATSVGGRAFVAAVRFRGRTLSARAGCGHLTREFWVPSGGGLPGVSGGTNGSSAWLGVRLRPTRALAGRVSILLTGSPWRKYYHELPTRGERVTFGVEGDAPGIGTVDVEHRVRTSIEGVDETERNVSSRTGITLRTEGESGLVLSYIGSSTRENEEDVGSLSVVSLRWEIALGESSLLSAGASSVTRLGDPDPVLVYEPGLPGSFSLRGLNTSGTRWYIRLKTVLGEELGVSARLAGGPERGRVALGLCIDLRG